MTPWLIVVAFLLGAAVAGPAGYLLAARVIRRRKRRSIGDLLGFLKAHGEIARRVAVPGAWTTVVARRPHNTVN